jgi:hypothetical protein
MRQRLGDQFGLTIEADKVGQASNDPYRTKTILSGRNENRKNEYH